MEARRARSLSLDPAEVAVRAFRAVDGEVDATLVPVEGQVPAGLRGVLYRNGPGSLVVEGTPQMHPFDGDGMVSRFELGPGGVHYRNRYVRTHQRVAEASAGRMLYRAFGTNLPGGFRRNALRVRFKNAANTSVVRHGGALLALWEGGLPHALDPVSLATLGPFDYAGGLRNDGPWVERLIAPALPFSAHPSVCPLTGELYNFGLLVGPKPMLALHRVSPRGVLRETRRVALQRPSFVHDFVLTDRWAVFFLSPVRFDAVRALSGLSSPVDSIARDASAPTDVLFVPRDGGPPRRVQVPGCFVFHFFGGFEREDGAVVVDGCRMDDFAGGRIDLRDPDALRSLRLPEAFPTRWVLWPNEGRASVERLTGTPMELPTVSPRDGRRLGWGQAKTQAGGVPVHTALARLDRETGRVRLRDMAPDLPGEPIVVLKQDAETEDDAWLLSLVYRARDHRTDLFVLEARDLSTVARVELPHHHPPGFHGCFVPEGLEPGSA
jgi:all-trans-8'-apo-beta-carotenal 15,15'-oxygenase